MQVNLKNTNLTFKQIILSENEFQEAKKHLEQLVSEPNNPSHNYKMFDLFESHLNNEVELKKYVAGKDRRYFSTNLYIKFFEILRCTKEHNWTIESFVTNLNNYIDRFIIKKNVENDDPNLLNYNVTSAQKAAHNFCTKLGLTKKDFLILAEKVPFLSYKSGNSAKRGMDEISDYFKISQEECLELYKRNPQAILRSSEWLINHAQNIMKILNVEDINEYKTILKNNAQLLTFEELEDSIKTLAEFLDTENENIITIMRTQPLLANMKLDHIKGNFYAMKNYLKVSRDKMSEIALLAPVTIKDPFALNKLKYESIANTLGISFETFVNRANYLPAIYRITHTKLERYIDFIAQNLDFTKEEAINYISRNLNILSYTYSNMSKKTEDNFELLNEELGFDYNTYKYLLKENAWLLGHKKELIIESIRDLKNYFNIDNATLSKLIKENPQLLTFPIKIIIKNIQESFGMMNLTEDEYKEMCLKEPKLPTRAPKFHHSDLPKNSELFRISEYEFIEHSKANPKLLTTDFDSMQEIKKRIDFLILNNTRDISLSNSSINNEETFFEALLISLLAGTLGITTDKKTLNLKDIIFKFKNKIIELKLPKHELSEKFNNYVKNFIKNNNLESKCKILLKNNIK